MRRYRRNQPNDDRGDVEDVTDRSPRHSGRSWISPSARLRRLPRVPRAGAEGQGARTTSIRSPEGGPSSGGGKRRAVTRRVHRRPERRPGLRGDVLGRHDDDDRSRERGVRCALAGRRRGSPWHRGGAGRSELCGLQHRHRDDDPGQRHRWERERDDRPEWERTVPAPEHCLDRSRAGRRHGLPRHHRTEHRRRDRVRRQRHQPRCGRNPRRHRGGNGREFHRQRRRWRRHRLGQGRWRAGRRLRDGAHDRR